MSNVLIVLSAIAVISLLSFLQNILNIKKEHRIRQFPMVVLSVIWVTGALVFLIKYRHVVAALSSLSSLLLNSEILILNAVLIAAYVFRKLILRPIITAIFKDNKLMTKFALDFYEYDDVFNFWFIKEKWANFRKYVFAIVVGLTLASGLFLGLTFLYGPSSFLWVNIIPCAALIIVNEFYDYINGYTRREFNHRVYGSDVLSQRIGNYYKLRELLEKLLPEALLSGQSGNEFLAKETPKDILKEWSEKGDPIDQITAQYFLLKDRYKTADIDCVQATLAMMHRRNVIFFNPFYKDLSMYVVFPAVRALLSGKNVVILCGRNNMIEDVSEWMRGQLSRFSHMRSLWRVGILTKDDPLCEVGVLTFTQIYDKDVILSNDGFFKKTDFVIMLEPTALINTSQTALSILSDSMGEGNNKPVYCICDRHSDGIVDTMSHILRSEITDVVAMPVPRCSYTSMSWDADNDFHRQELFDKQTKYLGNGLEIAAIAVKNQVPEATWYSATKVPVKDIKWIAGQYYSTICRYMNLPCQQKNLYERVHFVSNLWSSEKTKEQFIIVEDEFNNIFSTMRTYLSRGTSQVFVNVLAEDYLLRDYMRCNKRMFLSNPDAIPSYVPDYAKTERNTILKLIIMMSLRSVTDEEIIREFNLAGLKTDDALATMQELMSKYTYAEPAILQVRTRKKDEDAFTVNTESLFTISEDLFEEYFADSLKNAYYVVEEEVDETDYIDSKMFSHVMQTILPGQFVTYDGKYYQAKYVNPQSGVILRRASDLFDSRKYYRQVRHYHLKNISSGHIISDKKIMDMEFLKLRTDIEVDTTGYLELNDNHNLRTARLIDYTNDPSVVGYTRRYRNKTVLRIKLPESDEKLCFTICLMLAEVFRSLFPEGWPYLAPVTCWPDDIDGILNYMVYSVDGDVEPGYIYIVEDSDVDLGLIDAVEKNFYRIMEIITDFLEWHFEKMREPAAKDPQPIKTVQKIKEEKNRRGLVVKMLDRIRRLFGNKKKEDVKIVTVEQIDGKESSPEAASADQVTSSPSYPEANGEVDIFAPVENTESEAGIETSEYTEEDLITEVPSEENDDSEAGSFAAEVSVAASESESPKEVNSEDLLEPEEKEDSDIVHVDGTDIFDDTGASDDNEYFEANFEAMGITPVIKSQYQQNCFLKFGYEEIDPRLRIDDLMKYLRVRGWANNSLTLARTRELNTKDIIDLKAINHCDFCGMPLSGVSFERLNDGRVRCNDCSSSALNTVDEFRTLFFETLEMMEGYYGIKYKVPINVKVADAKELNKATGRIFKPTTEESSPRVLGFARLYKGTYSLVIENGSPRLAATDTMVHEMTHIWQYLNWDDNILKQFFGMASDYCTSKALDILYEGMAMWSAVQYLYQIGEVYYASRQERLAELREDIYGIGFRLFRDQYPFVKDSSLLTYTPFTNFPPLDPFDVIGAVRKDCKEEKCKC